MLILHLFWILLLIALFRFCFVYKNGVFVKFVSCSGPVCSGELRNLSALQNPMTVLGNGQICGILVLMKINKVSFCKHENFCN